MAIQNAQMVANQKQREAGIKSLRITDDACIGLDFDIFNLVFASTTFQNPDGVLKITYEVDDVTREEECFRVFVKVDGTSKNKLGRYMYERQSMDVSVAINTYHLLLSDATMPITTL